MESQRVALIEEPSKPAVELHRHLSLKGAVCPIEIATASAAVARMVNSLNIMGSDLWSKLNVYSPNNLLDLGIHASVLVLISTLVYFH